MRDRIKGILDKECFSRELPMQQSKFRQCEYLLENTAGTSSWCWLCHRNDELAKRLEDEFPVTVNR